MIDKLNRVPKIDNAKKLAKTDSIPENEKYTADEWNERDAKIDELVEQTNVNTLEIIEGYSNLLTNPVDRQRVFIKGVSEADNAKVIKKQGSVSTRGFYRYDLQTDKWYQETSIVEGESIKQGTLTDNQFTDANGDIIEAEEGKLYLDGNKIYRFDGANYVLLNPELPAPKKPFATTFAEFPDTPDLNDIIHLIFNDDDNIPSNATPLTAGKETAGYWRFDGTNWIQLLTTNTASGSAFL